MSFFRSIVTKLKRSNRSSMHSKHHHTILPITRNKAFSRSRPSGFAAYARAARRYGFDAPTVVGRKGVVSVTRVPIRSPFSDCNYRFPQVFKKHPASGKSGSGESEVPADDVQNDLEYVVPVTIGTPGVTLDLDFDTG